LFYSLVCTRAPWLAEQFEAILNKSNLPRLTQRHSREFSVPIGNGEDDFITFRGYDLAPPEGYIAVDSAKCIHRDSHSKEFSWACYWNLCRRNSENLVGAESGASFFLAEYGIRIITRQMDLLAGRFQNGMELAGITMKRLKLV
jgi:hypothetical protein